MMRFGKPGKPVIYVFCNSCASQWHSIVAIAEDGTGLTGHLCSDHYFIAHDMGFIGDWKHDVYDKHYPDGWQLEHVEGDEIAGHTRLQEAFRRNRDRPAAVGENDGYVCTCGYKFDVGRTCTCRGADEGGEL